MSNHSTTILLDLCQDAGTTTSHRLLNPLNATTPSRRYLTPVAQAAVTSAYALGLAANACALALLRRQRNQKLVLMVRCLAVNDSLALVSSFALVYMRLYLPGPVLSGRWFCGLRLLTRFFGFSSGCVACVMALERFVALTRPFFYQKHVTKNLVRRAILLQWCLVMVVVLLPLMGFGLYYRVDPDTCRHVCLRYRQATRPRDQVYAYIMFGFGTTLCAVIVVCNLAVVGALCRLSPQSKVRRSTSSATGGLASGHQATQEELSFARLMVALCVLFVVCWLPQMVSILVAQASPATSPGHPLFRAADGLTALHFFVDPVAYVLSRRPNRRGLRRLLKPLCQHCWGAAPQSSRATPSGGSQRTRPNSLQQQPEQPAMELQSR